MKTVEMNRLVALGRWCLCGSRAVTYRNACWTCAGCIRKDRAIYGTDRIRSTCGFALRMSRAEITAIYGE